jgi:hypothetical protein
MDGDAARVAESESGEERINSSPNAVIHFVSSKKLLTGLNCWVTEKLFRRNCSRPCDRNVTN